MFGPSPQCCGVHLCDLVVLIMFTCISCDLFYKSAWCSLNAHTVSFLWQHPKVDFVHLLPWGGTGHREVEECACEYPTGRLGSCVLIAKPVLELGSRVQLLLVPHTLLKDGPLSSSYLACLMDPFTFGFCPFVMLLCVCHLTCLTCYPLVLFLSIFFFSYLSGLPKGKCFSLVPSHPQRGSW